MWLNEELRPGIITGTYPERQTARRENLASGFSRLIDSIKPVAHLRRSHQQRIIQQINKHTKTFRRLPNQDFLVYARRLGSQLKAKGLTDQLVILSFAVIREMARRTLKQRHYDVQLIGGWFLLKGMLTEMDTGEGKTLTATLPACAAALAGIPVHIVTANDYLVRRDASAMAPLYKALGLSVGTITEDMDLERRRAEYACNITYCTSKQLAFDYLRDRLTMGQETSREHLELEKLHSEKPRLDRLLLPGLYFAIIDEADSVLIDEASNPLVISQEKNNISQQQACRQALSLASKLDEAIDYVIDEREQSVRLTDQGSVHLEELGKTLSWIWTGRKRREYLVVQALNALHIFKRDKHYLVKDGKIQIIDEYTGRLIADQSWQHGLHQMIEAKEACELTGNRETLASITYQKFFRRYLHLAGMSGTAREIASEVRSVYGLPVIRIPPRLPSQRTSSSDKVYWTTDAKWQAIIDRAKAIHQTGRPLLIGTRSVSDSEYLGKLLDNDGLDHRVLNARHDEQEAEIIARAGQSSRITVATNMAGRGTDIRLDQEAKTHGGLHVIATARHDAHRIDRQLFGRCARQGDPGSCEAILSLQDDIVYRYLPEPINLLLNNSKDRKSGSSSGHIGRFTIRIAQHIAEKRHRKMRKQLTKLDKQLDDRLAFTGQGK